MMNKAEKEMMTQMQAQMQAMQEQMVRMMQMMSSTASAPEGTAKDVSGEKVAYTKADGSVVYVSPKQAAAWDAWKANSKAPQYSSKEEFTQAMQDLTSAFKWTKKADAFIKAHPVCTQKEFSAAGFKGCTKQMLKAHKAEMRANGLIK